MFVRPATPDDLVRILPMFDHSRSLMRADGNMVQWTGYPTPDDLSADIRNGHSYVVVAHRQAVGTFALVPGTEPTYAFIDHGRWIDTASPYSTLHRLAKARGAHGIAAAAFAFAKQSAVHLRIDTHESNRPMRHILANQGFVGCGTVYMSDSTPRLAYEWWRWPEVPDDLQAYTERYVLPRYNAFDGAHRSDHARRVIARTMTLYRQWRQESRRDLPPAAAFYAAAAFHDIGLAKGRDLHHLASGALIRHNSTLRRWFSPQQIELIAQAAEDHRASASLPPRSLVGCAVAEADRDVEPVSIVARTVAYGLSHYAGLDREGHWVRTLQHLHEKYADHGYITLWLTDSPNAAPLAELRALIRDTVRLRGLFDSLFDDLSSNANPSSNS